MTEKKKSNSGLITGLIAAAVVAIVAVVIAVLCLNKPGSGDQTAKLDYSDSFFISDNGKYLLWNDSGKRLTEDEYSNKSEFVAGYAMVRKGDQYGIIKDDGRMSVDYGKYGRISNEGGLYLAEDGNTKEESLITGSGKVLAKGDDLDVYSPGSTGGFAGVKVDGKIKFYNYNGTLMFETDAVDEADDPDINSRDDFGIVHYGNQNWVFDARDGKVLAKFEGSRYGFDTVSDSRKMILLSGYEDENGYKLIANDKVYDLNETKYYGMTALDQLIGYDDHSELALLDGDYKVAKKVSTYLDLKDINNYATELTDGGVAIYQNGEKVKEFGEGADIATSGILFSDYYAIEENDKAKFYNLDGSVAFNGREFESIRMLFDENGNAIVADVEDEYYLLNNSGEKVSDVVASRISVQEGGYELKNEDGKYAIANRSGKPVTDFKYDLVSYRTAPEPRNIWTGRTEDEKYDIIDADSGKVIAEGVEYDGIYRNYFTVRKDGGLAYYTYDGNIFYEKTK